MKLPGVLPYGLEMLGVPIVVKQRDFRFVVPH